MAIQTSQSHDLSRRGFLVALAATAACPPTQGAVPGQAVDHQAELIEGQMAIVTSKYGIYLEETELKVIRRGLERLHRNALEMLKTPIGNANAPDFLFSPDGQ